jgi:hypothetical protein
MAHPIQIILTMQLAGYLSVPTFLVDPNGALLFYNEPAEVLLGRRFDETSAMRAEEWSPILIPVDPGKRAECAMAESRDALELDPNLAFAHAMMGLQALSGQSERRRTIGSCSCDACVASRPPPLNFRFASESSQSRSK